MKPFFALARHGSSPKGFTLVELIVAISIMVMILTITLSSRPDAINRLTLADEVSSVHLMLRQAQLQGSSINSLGGTYGGAGVYFDLATSTRVIFFKDKTDGATPSLLGVGNGIYDQNLALESYENFRFSRGNRIKKLCVSLSTSTPLCNDDNTPAVKNLTISFDRPSTEANIYINNATETKYVTGCIEVNGIKAPEEGYVRSVFVYKSGMMEKKVGPCM